MPVNTVNDLLVVMLLRTTATSPVDDVSGKQNVVAQHAHRKRSECGWLPPVKTCTFYDGDTGSHKARRKK
jgi:hypothetical protein